MADKITISDIELAVRWYFGLEEEDICGPSKERLIAGPRKIVMLLARDMTSLSFPKIGAYLHRDHSTVVHDVRRMRWQVKNNPKVAAFVAACRERVKPRKKAELQDLASQPLVKQVA